MNTGIQSLVAKYAPALLPMAIALVGGLQVAMADNDFTAQEVWQFVALAAGAIVTWAVPLLDARWAGALKVAANVLAAVAVLLADMLTNGSITWNATTIIFVSMAALQALSAEIGVGIRLDAVKPVLDAREAGVVPVITTVDPKAVQAAETVQFSN